MAEVRKISFLKFILKILAVISISCTTDFQTEYFFKFWISGYNLFSFWKSIFELYNMCAVESLFCSSYFSSGKRRTRSE